MDMFQIDVKEVLQQKAPFLAKIPIFVSWLKKTVHEEGINACLRSGGNVTGIAFAAAALDFFQARVEIRFTTRLDPQGRYVFVANHPLGGLDGVALVKAIGDYFPELRFPVNDILLAIKRFQPVFIPINKLGGQSREGANQLEDAYLSRDQQVLMFPAGLVSRKIGGKIVDVKWQKNFIKKAIKHHRDIVPVHIEGRNSNRFYRIANWGKRLGFPIIAMLYLPDEMFKQKNKTIRITVGEPIPYGNLNARSAQDEADVIKQKVYELA